MSRTSEPAAERHGGSIGTLLTDLEPEERTVALAAIRCAFAAVAMNGLLAHDHGLSRPHVAENSVDLADALIAELSKPTPPAGGRA